MGRVQDNSEFSSFNNPSTRSSYNTNNHKHHQQQHVQTHNSIFMYFNWHLMV